MRKIAIALNILLIIGLLILWSNADRVRNDELATIIGLLIFAGINIFVIDIHGSDKGLFQSYLKRLQLEQDLKIKKLNEQLSNKTPQK